MNFAVDSFILAKGKLFLEHLPPLHAQPVLGFGTYDRPPLQCD
jgi:hypothetical protein